MTNLENKIATLEAYIAELNESDEDNKELLINSLNNALTALRKIQSKFDTED
jgi:uncharacterized coiled-coil protein SlyX